MRVLLDESLPRTLKQHFPGGHPIETVFDRGWSGLTNGQLLKRAAKAFDVFLTADQNLQYQQNLRGYAIRVVVLAAVSNRVVDLAPLLERALELGAELGEGEVVVVKGNRE